MSDFNKFFILEKYDGFQGVATGIATAEIKDRDNEILDYAKSKPHFMAWSESVKKDSDGKSLGNVRLQHKEDHIAGKLTDIQYDDDNKLVRVSAKIIDPLTKELLQEGCLTGFSIGGRYVDKTVQADGSTRYVADPCEISMVDRPCLAEAAFQSVKADGGTTQTQFFKSDKKKTKRVAGHDLPPSAFLIVGDHDKTDTWHLPVDFPTEEETKSHIRNALARINQVQGISSEQRSNAHARLVSLAGKHGIKHDSTKAMTIDAIADYAALAKGITAVDEMAVLLDTISNLQKSASWSSDWEGEEEQLPLLLIEALGTSILSFKSAESEMENKEMSNELLEKARKSLAEHVAKAKEMVSAHHEKCMKLHKSHHDAMHAHLDKMCKVVGGGPESEAEGGEPEDVEEMSTAGAAPQASGASDTASKADIAAEIQKGIKEGIKEIFGALNEANKGVGDRAKAQPFVKAVSKTQDNQTEEVVEKMTDEDWKKYASGDQKAIRKAQSLTGQKWQPIPTRLLNRK